MADSIPEALEELHSRLLGGKLELEAKIKAEQDRIRRHDLRGELSVVQMRIFGIEQHGIDVLTED